MWEFMLESEEGMIVLLGVFVFMFEIGLGFVFIEELILKLFRKMKRILLLKMKVFFDSRSSMS